MKLNLTDVEIKTGVTFSTESILKKIAKKSGTLCLYMNNEDNPGSIEFFDDLDKLKRKIRKNIKSISYCDDKDVYHLASINEYNTDILKYFCGDTTEHLSVFGLDESSYRDVIKFINEYIKNAIILKNNIMKLDSDKFNY